MGAMHNAAFNRSRVCLLVLVLACALVAAREQWTIPGERVSYRYLSSSPANVTPSRLDHVLRLSQSSKLQVASFTLDGGAVFDEVLSFRSLGHFDRERIPERVVHAKGSTFYGTFHLTNEDIARFTKASLFNGRGKKTRVAVRFSTSLSERGSADTVFGEVRGMGIKFYTEQGNYDQLCINIPVFFINDPQLFPQMTHAQKRDPRTDLRSADNLWHFFSLRPESLNAITFIYTDNGLPDGFRRMPAFAINAFKLTNRENEHFYAKFTWLPRQGIRNLNLSEALRIAGDDPDYARRDLFNSIENKNFPSWTLYMQVITVEEVQGDFAYNPFDATKLWPLERYPLMEVGTLTLTRNVQNAFAESEQIALNPANLVPGIEPSPDRLLRGRLFSYRDTQFYRLGANHVLIPVNREPQAILSERDGALRTDGNQGDLPNFYPNTHFIDRPDLFSISSPPFAFSMEDVSYIIPDSLEQQYQHARESYRSLTAAQRESLHRNLAFTLSDITQSAILDRVFFHLAEISPHYAEAVRAEMFQLGKSSLIY